MVKKLTTPNAKGKAAASSTARTPPKTTPGSAKPKTFKKRKAKADREREKAAAAEAAATAEASASVPPPNPVDASASVPSKPVDASASVTPLKPPVKASVSPSAVVPKPVEASTSVAAAAAAKENGVAGEKDGGGRKMSRREKMKWKEGDRMRGRERGRVKGEDRKTTTTQAKEKKDEKVQEGSDAGFIFMCNAQTKPECFRSGVFGLPRGKIGVVENIRQGAKLFLYDFDLKLLYGVYRAKTRGGLDLVRGAFHGKFPAQVKFKIDKDCLPLPESSFKHAIKDNYNSKGRFTQELSSRQVQRLLALFKPISVPQPSLQYVEERRQSDHFEGHMPRYVEERRPSQHVEEMQHPRLVEERRLPYGYEERRLSQHVEEIPRPHFVEERHAPMVVHPPLLGDTYKMTQNQYMSRLPDFQYAPPTYYSHVAPASNNRYHEPQVDFMYERSAPRIAAEATNRDPILARDYRALPVEIAARSDHVDELYHSYKLATHGVDIHQQDPYYGTTAYENSRPASTRVSAPGVPVSSLYSFAGAPAYR